MLRSVSGKDGNGSDDADRGRMHVALVITFHASRKDPLEETLERIHAGFLTSGLGEPSVQFALADGPLPGMVSSVDRVVKRYPDLQRFVSTASTMPTGPAVRMISNGNT